MVKFYTNFLLVFLLVFTSCKTNQVFINIDNPALVTIPANAKKAGLVNRSIPSEESKGLNALRQAMSGQTIKLIEEASAECVRGLSDALIQYQVFDLVKPLNQVELKTPLIGSLPTPLSWNEVENICKTNSVDLLFVLETFDSDLKIVPVIPVSPTKVNTVIDVVNTAVQTQVNITTSIKTAWRIYDPINKRIIDEFPLGNNLSIVANAATILNTIDALLARKEVIKQESNRLGRDYCNRIIPYKTSVTRDYYVKGNRLFKIATRKARTGNWDGAGDLWLQNTKSSKRKVASRAYYNMAILNEINGNLDAAISWAQQAYEQYNNKLALRYLNNLKFRKQDELRLQDQIGN